MSKNWMANKLAYGLQTAEL